jgi:hypothetical protein
LYTKFASNPIRSKSKSKSRARTSSQLQTPRQKKKESKSSQHDIQIIHALAAVDVLLLFPRLHDHCGGRELHFVRQPWHHSHAPFRHVGLWIPRSTARVDESGYVFWAFVLFRDAFLAFVYTEGYVLLGLRE